ncbi:hypothetical protein TRVL_08982 [Trypanosoma vivax]|nr:hypothetical protein TRVL_08982 [Trypanosoma vivax]
MCEGKWAQEAEWKFRPTPPCMKAELETTFPHTPRADSKYPDTMDAADESLGSDAAKELTIATGVVTVGKRGSRKAPEETQPCWRAWGCVHGLEANLQDNNRSAPARM